MELRNKKTGEIWVLLSNPKRDTRYFVANTKGKCSYTSLAELNEEWEDYEELKTYWYIDAFGNIVQNKITKHSGDAYTDMSSDYERQKQIGNYFETKKEAERAVKKLMAWKRLKDHEFRFSAWTSEDGARLDFPSGRVYDRTYERTDAIEDLNLLFGGKE